MDEKINIIILDDHAIIVDGLKLLLSFEKKIEVIKTYTNGVELLENLKNNIIIPDIILMDLLMPTISGLECSTIIKKEFPKIKIVILSMESDAKTIHQLINHIGVEGYLNKSVSKKELADCLDLVSKGYIYLSEEAETCFENYKEKLFQNEHIKLSPREKDIVKLMIVGNTNTEISQKLFISESTVETHRKNIYRKTDTHSVPKLTLLVNELNLLN